MGALPEVLEASHPLMEKFQQTLKQFLERENEIAEAEVNALVSRNVKFFAKYDTYSFSQSARKGNLKDPKK